jgi:hypothetical protein
MLDKAASGMFSLMERKLAKVSDDFKGELKKYMSVKRKMKSRESEIDGWHLIYDQHGSSNYQAQQKHAKIQAMNSTQGGGSGFFG